MNILRSIRQLFIRPRETKLSGINFNKEDNSIQVKVTFVGVGMAGKSSLVWACNHRAPWTEAGPPPYLDEGKGTYVNTTHGLACISNCDAYESSDYDRLRVLNYMNTGIVAFVFRIDDPDSLENIEDRWKPEMDHFCPGVPNIVIGCKSDLRTNNRPRSLVDTQSGIDLATRLRARHYIECSAQQYVNIEKLLECIGIMAWEMYEHTKTKRSVPTHFKLTVTLPEKDAPREGQDNQDA
ncbi:hypothetical protein FRC06_006586 [Ceratobasidium sp. 370]|nr:hypothetical protein FRC06_006586 [Ceratobasidium sp. 370]